MDHARIREHQVLVDGDADGYLLQIFTKNLVGPIFIELIQRKNHRSFGEGNFGALFRSVERDPAKRGGVQRRLTRCRSMAAITRARASPTIGLPWPASTCS